MDRRNAALPPVGPAPVMDPDLLGAWPMPPYHPDEERVPRLTVGQELLALLEEHVAAEQKSLQAYYDLTASGDPILALLAGLLVKDEETHHRLLRSLVASLSESPYWKSQGKAITPARSAAALEEGEAEKIAATLASFLRGEKGGQKHLKQIAKRTQEDPRGLYAVLLEFMAVDSLKHQKVLAFLVDYLSPKSKAIREDPGYGGE